MRYNAGSAASIKREQGSILCAVLDWISYHLGAKKSEIQLTASYTESEAGEGFLFSFHIVRGY